MKEIIFKEDLQIMYISAHSFPNDIFKVHQELHSSIVNKDGRYYFGISFADGTGKIQYNCAATEMFEGEGASLNIKTAFLKKGVYHFISFPDAKEKSAENSEEFKILILTSKTALQVAVNKKEHSFL